MSSWWTIADVNTTSARHGDKGTSLPHVETGAEWKIGGEVEARLQPASLSVDCALPLHLSLRSNLPPRRLCVQVAWQVRNNHGGGYAYRLCPANMPLTEECFQAHHLDMLPVREEAISSTP